MDNFSKRTTAILGVALMALLGSCGALVQAMGKPIDPPSAVNAIFPR